MSFLKSSDFKVGDVRILSNKDNIIKLVAHYLIKEKESEGYSYDTAQASFELLARRIIGQLPEFFDIKRYKVTVERRKNKYNKMFILSEAVVVVKVEGQKKLSVSECVYVSLCEVS